LRSFLRYFRTRDRSQQRDILDGPIATGELVRQTRDGESRERLREAFNTPLYPMILLANEVMQEGLDLHRHCRRVVHHDLAWNPAQLEQRVGRVDRLGSLTHKLLEKDPLAKLDVLYPLVHRTIDERLYRTVKSREKWLEFLLGAPPDFGEYTFGDEEPPELPEKLAMELRLDLSPTGRSGASEREQVGCEGTPKFAQYAHPLSPIRIK
jgi:superfamily II DNA/RNA helicase